MGRENVRDALAEQGIRVPVNASRTRQAGAVPNRFGKTRPLEIEALAEGFRDPIRNFDRHLARLGVMGSQALIERAMRKTLVKSWTAAPMVDCSGS